MAAKKICPEVFQLHRGWTEAWYSVKSPGQTSRASARLHRYWLSRKWSVIMAGYDHLSSGSTVDHDHIVLPLLLCSGNGSSLMLTTLPSWNSISPVLCFSSKILLKDTHYIRVCPFLDDRGSSSLLFGLRECWDSPPRAGGRPNLSPIDLKWLRLFQTE